MILGLKVKALIGVAVAAAAFGVGWTAKGWLEDSKDLAAMTAAQLMANEIREDLGAVAKDMENQISKIKPTETIIDRGIVREIQTPVFRSVCIPPDSDSFRMLNNIAAGNDPGKPADQGSQDSADPD
jgi:hypothetical protein